MTSRILSEGRGAAGLLSYATHDEGHARTRERVAGLFTSGFGQGHWLPGSDEDKLAKTERLLGRILQSTATDAAALKRLAGRSTRGRKSQLPFVHIALSWAEHEHPSWAEVQAAGYSWLKANGLSRHRAVLIVHREPGKPIHLHLVISRVDAAGAPGRRVPRAGRSAVPQLQPDAVDAAGLHGEGGVVVRR